MEKTKKELFMEFFNNRDKADNKFMVIYMEAFNLPKSEMIINPEINIDNKLVYYDNAYNDDLELSSFTKIKIVDYKYIELKELSK